MEMIYLTVHKNKNANKRDHLFSPQNKNGYAVTARESTISNRANLIQHAIKAHVTKRATRKLLKSKKLNTCKQEYEHLISPRLSFTKCKNNKDNTKTNK